MNLPAVLDETVVRHGAAGGRLADRLPTEAAIEEETVYRALAARLGLEYLNRVAPHDLDQALLDSFPIEHLRRHRLLPLHETADTLFVATAEPLACGPLDELALRRGRRLQVMVMRPSTILEMLNETWGKGRDSGEIIETLAVEGDLEGQLEKIQVEDVLASANKAPIIKFVNTLIFQALRERASDIHLEMAAEGFRIRFRIDGVLKDRFAPPRTLHAPVTSRLKIMAALDIAERRLPQDGKIRVKFGDREVDIRVSCVPSAHGERVVLRLLDRKTELLTLEQMGMESDTLAAFDRLIRRPHGILLVTGPTGSGKTTTLYGAIMRVVSPEVNVITLEDPVEYEVPGASQIPVKPKIGFTFAAGLRSILRQDPDVIMVGEIRDEETAAMATQASLTGHLVFSTLHTNDAASAVVRLIDMRVEPYLVASTLIGVLAQRLVRRLCPACRRVGADGLWRAPGCEGCDRSGYAGRIGLFELLEIDEELSGLIGRKASLEEIRAAGKARGLRLLADDGRKKIQAGLTSREEVERVCATMEGG